MSHTMIYEGVKSVFSFLTISTWYFKIEGATKKTGFSKINYIVVDIVKEKQDEITTNIVKHVRCGSCARDWSPK